MDYVRAGCAALFAVIFAVSALSKARDFRGFARSVPAFAAVPARLVPALSVAVVMAEAATVVLVLVPATATAGFLLALVLVLAFAVAIARVVRRGRRASCRCFGASDVAVGPRHVVRNLLLAVAAVLGAVAPGPSLPVAGFAIAATAGLVLAILVVVMDDLAILFVRSS